MILLCCAGFLLTVLMTMSVMMLAVFPSLCYTIYHVAVILFDIVRAAVVFYWHIMMFIFEIMNELIRIVRPIFTHVMPVVCFYMRDVFENVRENVNGVWRNLNDIIIHREHGLMVMWGAIVAGIYFYWNQVIEAFRVDNGEQGQNVYNERNHYERPANPINPTGAGNRLYPDLSNINLFDNTNSNQNEQQDIDRDLNLQNNLDSENIGTRRRNLYSQPAGQLQDDVESRMCVVCFERERDTAVFPCGHTHTCMQCTLAIKRRNNLCPICQQHIREHKRVFV